MSYLLTGTASVQALSGAQDFQTLVKYSLSALEVDSSLVIPVTLAPNTPFTIPLTSLQEVQVIVVKSKTVTPVEVSLFQTTGVDTWTGLPSQFQMFVRSDAVVVTQLKLRSTAVTAVEVIVAGKFT
ncbi:hypothetical protein OsccyDRAFT_0748 [Leptolyngbyaceae cyanobacterium JSC-12]|nr:hypothetical protein OsccyDRAFT_0748 [Leptolyngbyaceae cyanobacterium JSC-12]